MSPSCMPLFLKADKPDVPARLKPVKEEALPRVAGVVEVHPQSAEYGVSRLDDLGQIDVELIAGEPIEILGQTVHHAPQGHLFTLRPTIRPEGCGISGVQRPQERLAI